MQAPVSGSFYTKPLVLWTLLFSVSVSSGCLLFWLEIPAPYFVAAMLFGLLFSLAGIRLALPHPLFICAQALIGCGVAKCITPNVWQMLGSHGLLLGAIVCCSILAGGLVGWSMMKSGIIPGMTAAWGSSPGGASAMVAMAEAYGADVRLVALMQYLRVMLVVLTASTVAHFLLSTKTPASGVSRGIQQLASFDGSLSQLALTLLITTVCSFLAYRLKIPAGSLLLTMVVGALLNSRGLVDFRLPGLFQAGASLFLGWHVGLGFKRELLASALKMMHWLFFSAFLLIALCAALSWVLHLLTACDPLTAYLATTPGGLDSVLLLAMDGQTDVPFVVAAQSLRLFLVILTGPMIARALCRLA